MKKRLLSSVFAITAFLPGAALAASVTLQGTTPGTSDSGNINVTGTIIGSDLQGSTLEVSGNASVGGNLSVVTLSNTASGVTNTLSFGTPTGSNKSIVLPDQSGTVCLDSNNCSDVMLQASWPGTAQTGDINIGTGELQAGNAHFLNGSFSGLSVAGHLYSQYIDNAIGYSHFKFSAAYGDFQFKDASAMEWDVNGSSGNTRLMLSPANSWNEVIQFPRYGGVLCVGNPADGCATYSLSNLSSVAINTSLLPASAGAADLGSNALPFGKLYVSNNAQVGGDLTVMGGVTINGGSKIAGHLSATSAQAAQSLSSSSPGCNSFNITVTGAAMGDTVLVSVDQALPGTWTLNGSISAADTVNVKACAFDNLTSIAAGTYRAEVWKH